MTNDKPTLDSIVAKVETILRLRAAALDAHQTLARTSRELATYKLELSEHEAALAEIMGVKLRSHKWDTTETFSDLGDRPGWMSLALKKRVPYPNATPGNIVWVGRREILGILQDKKGRVKSNGKIYKCDPKDLWYPYPGEPLPDNAISGGS